MSFKSKPPLIVFTFKYLYACWCYPLAILICLPLLALRGTALKKYDSECYFDSAVFICSGAEDKHGYIWDRHYNICLARLAHDDVVNSVAFSPADQELLLSASDDSTIKVWRSPRMVRLSQAMARPSRPRSLLSSWLSRNKNCVNGRP